MKAYVLKKYTPGWLSLEEIELPPLASDRVRIRIKAVSVNPVDFKIVQGEFVLPLPRIIGIDFSGEISDKGSEVKNFRIGDRVFGLANLFTQGTFAQYVDIDPNALSRMPETLTFEEAAVIPCAGITAWQAIMQKVAIPPESTLFITSGGGGVGGFAIQFARMLNTHIITTASKDFDRLHQLGAHHIINYKTESIPERIKELTDGHGVKTVVDMVSPQSAEQNAMLLRYNGSLVTIQGRPSGFLFEPFSKSVTFAEVALGAAYVAGDKLSLREMAQAGEEIARLICAKKIDPMISKIFKFEQLPEALTQVASRQTNGKVVVLVD